MSATLRGEAPAGQYPNQIDEILKLRDPQRTFALQDFIGEEDDYGIDDSTKVRLLSSDGAPKVVHFKGRKVNIGPSPNGRKVPRGLAVELIRMYGKGGRYHNRDRDTGILKHEFEMASEKARKEMGYHDGVELKFQTWYLTHSVDPVVETDGVDDDE